MFRKNHLFRGKELPFFSHMLCERYVSRRKQPILQFFSDFLLPLKQGFLTENIKGNGGRFAFLLLPSQHKAWNCHRLNLLNLAVALLKEVKVNVGASQSTCFSGNPLLGTLVHNKASNTLSKVFLTARILEVSLVS